MNKQLILSMAKQAGDPFADLYYVLDDQNGGKGLVSVGKFQWYRDKSNDNVGKHGHSFYLSRTVFEDEFKMRWEDSNNMNDDEFRFYLMGKPFGYRDTSLLVIISLEIVGDKFQIISSWENEKPRWEARYESNRQFLLESRAKRNIDYLADQMGRL